MKYSCAVATVLIFLSVASASAASLRETLGALYRYRDAAASRRDPAGCMTVCTPDFTYFTASAPPLSPTRLQNRLTRGYSTLRRARVTSTLQTLTAAPSGVTVLAQERTEAVLTDPLHPPGLKLVMTRSVRDFWVRTNAGNWKMKRRRLLRTVATVNGSLVHTNLFPSQPLPKKP